jgi:cell division protein FtsW
VYQLDIEKQAGFIKMEHLLITVILTLVCLGLVDLYSASFAFASRYERFNNNGWYFISRQLGFAAMGLVFFFAALRINLEWMRKFIPALMFFAAGLCLLTFVPGIGETRNGAARWIKIGPVTYQPSELVKLALPLYLAHIFDKKQDKLDRLASGILPPVLVCAVFFAFILMQNNLTTAVFIVLNALVIFLMAGVRFRYFLAAALVFLPVSVLFIFTKEYRVRRLISFINPDWDPQGAGYQVRASILAIMSGGLWGKGLGQGTRKIAGVPEVHSDFIFSAVAEESGFLGVLLVIALFVVFAFLGYRGVMVNKSMYKRLLGFGLVTTIVSQALLNMAVASGLGPVTGIPLPFFSAGGSSLATTLLCAGLIVNAARRDSEQLSSAGYSPAQVGSFSADVLNTSFKERQDGI